MTPTGNAPDPSRRPGDPGRPPDRTQPVGGDPRNPDRPPGSAAPRIDPERDQRLRDFVRRMERVLPRDFKDSDAVKRLQERFADIDWSRVSSKPIIPDSMKPNIDWDRQLRGIGRAMDRTIGRMDRGRMPRIRTPNVPDAPSLPTFSLPGTPGGLEAGGAITTIAVIAGVVGGLFLAWRLLLKPRSEAAASDNAWNAGDWPVDPARVSSREDVVKAFDHLALLRGGKIARHWHHQDAARHLGAPDEQQRVIADRLAGVYEQARYSPPLEPFPETYLEHARHDLAALSSEART